MIEHIRKLYEDKGLDAVWKWCMDGEGAHAKAKRFAAYAEFAGNRKQHPQKGDPDWDKVQRLAREERDKWEKRYENQHDDADWPASIVLTEYLYHMPGPHVHIASANRNALIKLAKVGQEKFGLRIGEFPPFDSVECVHVAGSWHYRDSSNPSVGRLCANRGDGLAFDANDADGGSDQEYAFYIEVGRRYR